MPLWVLLLKSVYTFEKKKMFRQGHKSLVNVEGGGMKSDECAVQLVNVLYVQVTNLFFCKCISFRIKRKGFTGMYHPFPSPKLFITIKYVKINLINTSLMVSGMNKRANL